MSAGAVDPAHSGTLGALLVAGHHWSYLVAMVFTAQGGLMLCYLLLRSKIAPRVISILGLVGYALLLVEVLLDMFGQGQFLLLLAPGGLFELIFPIWILVKGLQPPSSGV